MKLRQQYLTKNDCYKAGRTITIRGVMIHSTGANNPKVSRYVPGDREIGLNTGGNHWDMSNAASRKKFGEALDKCVHAFIGKFADGSVGTVQTMPWDRRAWHCGGTGNDTHIGFEICEAELTDKAYFNQIYQEAVELTAHLCEMYRLDPLEDGVVLDHSEGYKRKIASNHGDVKHWFSKHGKSMDDFRADVARELEGNTMTEDRIREIVRSEIEAIEAKRALQPVSTWARDLVAEAKTKGFTDGSRPQSHATRQEVMVMLNRLSTSK